MSVYVVTGGEGFIGRNLVSRIRKSGDTAISVDITGNPDFKVSVADFAGIRSAFKGCDGVFHLAAITSPPQFEDDLMGGFLNNVNGTLNVLRAAQENGASRVVFASSSATYGSLPHVADESMLSYEHENMYPLTKAIGELLGKFFNRRSEIEFVAMRYFNTYGFGENTKSLYSSVIWKFVEAASRSEDIVIFGDGSQSRDFVYVGDVAEATFQAMTRGKPGESYNVGTGVSTDFNTIAEQVVEISGTSSRIVHVKNPFRNYQMFTQADISKLSTQLGWKPGTSLREGIALLLDHANEERKRR